MKFLGLEIGSWAEWIGSLLSGIAIIMVVWQVFFERNHEKETRFLNKAIDKQEVIIACTRDIHLLLNQLLDSITTSSSEQEIYDIKVKLNNLLISIETENSFSKNIFSKYNIKYFNDVDKLTTSFSKKINSGKRETDLGEMISEIAVINFNIQNLCETNIKALINKQIK